MSRKVRNQRMILALIIALALIVSGCSSLKTSTKSPDPDSIPDTPTPEILDEEIISYGQLCKIGLSYILFPDSAELYIGPETEIEIQATPDPSAETPGYEVLLRKGHLIILSQPPQDIHYTVFSPDGYIAQLVGSLMYVGIEEDTGNFKALCLSGACNLGADHDSLVGLAAGNEGWLDKTGTFQGPFDIDINALLEGCGDDYISVVIPPPTATPDLDATATAFCGAFEEEHPGTPCP